METININDCPIALSWHEVVMHYLLGGRIYTYNNGDGDFYEEEIYSVLTSFFEAEDDYEKTLSIWDDPADTSYIFYLAPPSGHDMDIFEFRLDSEVYEYLNKHVREVIRDLMGKDLTFTTEEK